MRGCPPVVDEDIARHHHALRDLEEQAGPGALDVVADEHALDIAHVVPDGVKMRLLDDQGCHAPSHGRTG